MLPIKIDISDPVSQYGLSQAQSDALAHSVVAAASASFVKKMTDIANNKLHSTRTAYINGINRYPEGNTKYIVELVGFLPNALESGLSPFDMKLGFMASDKKKDKKNGGWYLTIPFRMATPGSLGDSGGFSGVMPTAIYNVVKGFKAKAAGIIPDRLTVGSIPNPHKEVGSRKEIIGSQAFAEYQHKNSIFAGMQKTGAEGHGQYNTFRRVSDKSDILSWVHSGIEAKRIAGDAFSLLDGDFATEIKMIIDNSLTEMGI